MCDNTTYLDSIMLSEKVRERHTIWSHVMCNLKSKQTDKNKFLDIEIGGCQKKEVGWAKWVKEKLQMFSYKITRSQGYDI